MEWIELREPWRWGARDNLSVNAFRQPVALPVYSMNLPQYANGFMYAFNKQTLEEED